MYHGTAHRKCAAVVMTLIAGLLASGALAAPCGEWSITPNPVFNGSEFRPSLIAAFAPDSAVAVSTPLGAGGLVRSTWDGSEWTTGSPESLNLDNAWDVRALTGSAPNDLWVSGLLAVDNFHGVPFLAHFDGQQWDVAEGSLLDDPDPQGGDPVRSGEGSSIAVIAPDDIWVVGYGDSPNGTSSSPVTFHWDGSNLEEFVPQIQPVFGRNNNTKAVAATASDDVWIVGYGRNVTTTFHLFIYHFDGSSWNPQVSWSQLPGQNIVQDQLHDVVAFARDDAWAVGNKLVLSDGSTQSMSLYLHWDGTGWTEVAGPDIGPITSASGSGPDDIWVSNAFGEYGGRLAHWDGVAWKEVNSASIPGATHIGMTNLASSPAGDTWAVGYWAIYDGAGGWTVYEDILEQFTPGCSGDLDGDGDVDAADYATFADCMRGPFHATATGCERSDLNGNGTTELSDFMLLQGVFATTP